MKLNPLQLMLDADIIVKFVILLLLTASVVCWGIIYQKILRFRRILKDNDGFMEFFDRHTSMEQINRHAMAASTTTHWPMFTAQVMPNLKKSGMAPALKVMC
jgi:biopolymer transport protein ExbB/TolQ